MEGNSIPSLELQLIQRLRRTQASPSLIQRKQPRTHLLDRGIHGIYHRTGTSSAILISPNTISSGSLDQARASLKRASSTLMSTHSFTSTGTARIYFAI